MSQTVKIQRMLIVSGSSEYTVTVSQLTTPTHVEPSGSIARASDGSLWKSLDGGNWSLLGSGTPDGATLSSLTGVLNALPLSGTINARFVNLSGTIDGHFNALSGTVNSAFVSLSGTINSGIVALSGTINARFKSIWPAGDVDDLSGSIASAIAHVTGTGGGGTITYTTTQRFSYSAVGNEGSNFTVTMPVTMADTTYNVFFQNASTSSYVANIPASTRTTASFQVLLTAAPAAGEELDFLVIPSFAVSASLTGVAHDSSMTGDGTSANPLSAVAYRGSWVAGSYPTGAIVSRGGYSFGANRTTSEDPLRVEGNISSSTDWLLGPTTPINNGIEAVFVNNQTSKNGQAIARATGSTWDGRRFAFDLNIQGGADGPGFGIIDAAIDYTSLTGTNALTSVKTAWGVNVDIFNGRVQTLVDGTASNNVTYSNASAISAGTLYDRWYVNMTLTGSNVFLELYRNDYTHLDNPALITSWTVVKPTYTAYRIMAGGWSGGIAGTFKLKGVTTRVSSSGDWTRLGPQTPLV